MARRKKTYLRVRITKGEHKNLALAVNNTTEALVFAKKISEIYNVSEKDIVVEEVPIPDDDCFE